MKTAVCSRLLSAGLVRADCEDPLRPRQNVMAMADFTISGGGRRRTWFPMTRPALFLCCSPIVFYGFSITLWAAEPSLFLDLDARSKRGGAPAFKDPFGEIDASGPSGSPSPFADLPQLGAPAMPGLPGGPAQASGIGTLFGDGVAFKKEIMLEVSRSASAADESGDASRGLYSRQSAGFELLKKFSSSTATHAAFDLQMRLVRRDNFHEVLNDAEGADRRGWFLEYHNVYWDFYNVLNPVLGDENRSAQVGRFNFRLGRFYLPFGLNLQSDTHGSVLQLSNERNFGFERDWYAGLWGAVNRWLNYDLYYLVGSGYHVAFRGQSGLLGSRLSLSNFFLNELGIEGGFSFLGGQRISSHALERSPSVAEASRNHDIVDTLRYGGDLRWAHPIPTGSLRLSSELSLGRDERDPVWTQLYQADYLTLNRKFGTSAQYRRFKQGIQAGPSDASLTKPGWNGRNTDASMVGEVTWYFRNDLDNSNLHWVKLNVERKVETTRGRPDTIVTLQYYRYW